MVHQANLSSDQYYLAGHLYCYLCGTTIDRKFAESPGGVKSWRAYAQELTLKQPELGEGPLVEPELCPLVVRGEPRRVHQACYSVLDKLVKHRPFSAAQLGGFLDCARDIDPFLPQIPSGASPDRLDDDLAYPDLDLGSAERMSPAQSTCYDAESLGSEGIQASALVSSLQHDAPPNLGDLVSEALAPDFDPETCADSSISDFLSAAQLLQGLPPFRSLPESELARAVTQALRNFNKGGAARFPHTANFDVVRANALDIFLRLASIPLEEVPSAAWKDGKRPKLQGCRRLPAAVSASPALYVRHFTLRREYYAGNETYDEDGRRIGGKYLRDIGFATGDPDEDPDTAMQVAVHSPCGLEFVRDGIAVVRVRVMDSGGWRTVFEREGVPDYDDEDRFPRAKVEWAAGSPDEDFFIVSDTCRDRWLFKEYSTYMEETGLLQNTAS